MNGKRKKKRDNRGLVIILLVCLLLAAAGGGFSLYWFSAKEKQQVQYTEKLKTVKKYVRDDNYEDALILCQEIIEEEPEEPDAYLIMAEIYVEQKEFKKARSIASTGYSVTGVKSLHDKYEEVLELMSAQKEAEAVQTESAQTETEKETVKEKEEDTGSVLAQADSAAGDRLMKFLAGATHSDYEKEYAAGESQGIDSDGNLVMRYGDFGGDVLYSNEETGEGTYSDITEEPAKDSLPYCVELDNFRNIFGIESESAITYSEISSLLGFRPEKSIQTESGYRILQFSLGECVVYAGCDEDGNVPEGSVWNRILIPAGAGEEEAVSYVRYEGIVVDATSGSPVEDAAVKVQLEDGGTEYAYTDADGKFQAELPAGTQQITITADGFIAEDVTVTVTGEEESLAENIAISPSMESGEIRIVLEWNELPSDLDSHLYGAFDGGSSFHTYFSSKDFYEDGELKAELDVDDTTSYGPETITLHSTDGSFEYWVHDYTDGRDGSMCAVSGATVKVYQGGSLLKTYTVPSGGSGTWWKVFTIDHGEITDVNRMQDRDY